MITGQLRSQVDRLWEEFWTGGITNPLTVIEQISFLMFIRLMDVRESRLDNFRLIDEDKLKSDELAIAVRTGDEGPPERSFRAVFRGFEQHLRWKNFKELSGEEMLPFVRDE